MRRFPPPSPFFPKSVFPCEMQEAFETAAGRPLDRFFDKWIYGIGAPGA